MGRAGGRGPGRPTPRKRLTGRRRRLRSSSFEQAPEGRVADGRRRGPGRELDELAADVGAGDQLADLQPGTAAVDAAAAHQAVEDLAGLLAREVLHHPQDVVEA